MSNEKALDLATSLELCWDDLRLEETAAELRRLVEENDSLRKQLAQPTSKPMTEEQIRAMCKNNEWVLPTAILWVRLTESHHNIKETP